MKKINLLVIVLFSASILSGCSKAEKSGDVNSELSGKDGNQAQETDGSLKTSGSGLSIIDSLKNAISSGKKMKCTYKMNNEGGMTEVVTYMQGDKYKTEIVMGNIKTESVFDGDAMYSWSSGQKTGTKMTMDCINGLDTKGETESENIPEVATSEDSDNFMETLSDAENLSCEDAGDVDFSIPTDINFVDQCEMLKSQQNMIESFNNVN